MSIRLSEELTYENAVRYMRETFPNELIECESFKNYDTVLKKMDKELKNFGRGKQIREYYKECNRRVIEKIREHDEMENKECMKNIFENAKFGNKFITRDGKIAIYHYYNGSIMKQHYLILESGYGVCCKEDGHEVGYKESHNDIISRK